MSTPAAFCYLSWQSWHWFPLIVWLVNVYPSEHQENTEGGHGATGTGNKLGNPFQTEWDTMHNEKYGKMTFETQCKYLSPRVLTGLVRCLLDWQRQSHKISLDSWTFFGKFGKGFSGPTRRPVVGPNWAEQVSLAGDVFFTRLATVWLVWFCLICGAPCSEIIPEPARHPVSRTLEVEDSQYGAWIHWSVLLWLRCIELHSLNASDLLFQYVLSSLDQRVWKMPHWLRCPKIQLKIQNCNSHLGWSGMDQFKMAGLVYRFYIT